MKKNLLTLYNMAPEVVAFSTTRHGGYSTGDYGEFNINRFCGDDPTAIQRNREALALQLGIDEERIFMPHQVHEAKVLAIDDDFLTCPAERRMQALEGIDAVMTNLVGICVGVSTADCIPVLLYDQQHHAVCAVHAGWRGTVQRIVGKAVEAMTNAYGSQPIDLMAQIGPGISLDSFEVGDEVYNAFATAGFDMNAITERREKWHINLPECNRRQLIEAGLNESAIAVSPECTYKNHDTYFSARRLGINSGRIFTAIMLTV